MIVETKLYSGVAFTNICPRGEIYPLLPLLYGNFKNLGKIQNISFSIASS